MITIQEAVVENSKWIDGVLLTGGSIAGTCVLAKLLGVRTIEVLHSEIPVTAIWIVLAALTIAHFYVAWLLNRSIFKLWSRGSEERSREVFQEITAKGGLLVRGLSPRTAEKTWLGLRVYEMRFDDPSTWAAHAIALLMVAAIVPFDFDNKSLFWRMMGIALSLALANWLIGSSWIIRLSELNLSKAESRLLKAHQERRVRPPTAYLKITAAAATFGAAIIIGGIIEGLRLFASTGLVERRHLNIGLTVGLLLLVPLLARRALAVRRFGRAFFVVLSLILFVAIVSLSYWWGMMQ